MTRDGLRASAHALGLLVWLGLESVITADANEPLWDGARIDHGAVIDARVTF